MQQVNSNSKLNNQHPKVNSRASNLSRDNSQAHQDRQDHQGQGQLPTWRPRIHPTLSLHCPQH